MAQLLLANVPGLVVNAGAYALTTAMAMYAQESALKKPWWIWWVYPLLVWLISFLSNGLIVS